MTTQNHLLVSEQLGGEADLGKVGIGNTVSCLACEMKLGDGLRWGDRTVVDEGGSLCWRGTEE